MDMHVHMIQTWIQVTQIPRSLADHVCTQAFSQKGIQASWDAPKTNKWTSLDAQILGEKGNYFQLFP
jgi:hypothetical protein